MPGPKPKPIELSDTVRRELEKLVARHTTGQQKAQRARIILKAAEGKVVSLMCVGEGRIFSIFSPANTLAGDYRRQE